MHPSVWKLREICQKLEELPTSGNFERWQRLAAVNSAISDLKSLQIKTLAQEIIGLANTTVKFGEFCAKLPGGNRKEQLGSLHRQFCARFEAMDVYMEENSEGRFECSFHGQPLRNVMPKHMAAPNIPQVMRDKSGDEMVSYVRAKYADAYDNEQAALEVEFHKIRSVLSRIYIKSAMLAFYEMKWQVSNRDIENLLMLYQMLVAMPSYHEQDKTAFNAIRATYGYEFAKVGVRVIVPKAGEVFDPRLHMRLDAEKSGVGLRILGTGRGSADEVGYERGGQVLIKAIVTC